MRDPFPNFRTRLSTTTPAAKAVRRCTRCNAVLSSYSRGDICMACEDNERAATVEQEMDRAVQVAAMESEIKQRQRRGRMESIKADGFELTPVDVVPPNRRNVLDYGVPIEAFLASGAKAVVVKSPNGAKANTVREAIARTLREAGEMRCYATVSRAECYLVRCKN